MQFPKVIITSVVRTSTASEAHGFLYLLDLDKETILKTIRWEDASINFEGRGGDRGLRGIEFYNNRVFVASGTRLLEFDKDLNLVNSYTNNYLLDCHEIARINEILFVTSSGFDSVLEFNMDENRFTKGYMVRNKNLKQNEGSKISNILRKRFSIVNLFFHYFDQNDYLFEIYDPESENGPDLNDTIHLNMVSTGVNSIDISGTKSNHLLKIKDDKLSRFATIPKNTHNAQIFRENEIITNYTAIDKLTIHNTSGIIKESYPIPLYNEDELENDVKNVRFARQGFARGLVLFKYYFIAGYSPATVIVFRKGNKIPVKKVNLSMDIRNAIHGLEVFPY